MPDHCSWNVTMKLENDPGFGIPSPPRKSYNPFDSDDDPLETPGLKAVNGFRKGGYEVFDLKPVEKAGDKLPFRMTDGDFTWEEAVLSHSTIVDNAINADVNVDKSLFQKRTEFFTDKNVTECDFPEFIVCYKESSYHSVKDISIDDGVPSRDKVCLKAREEYSEDLSGLLGLGSKNTGSFDVQIDNLGSPIPEGLKMDGLNLEAVGRQDSDAQRGNGVSVEVSDSEEKAPGLESGSTAAEAKSVDDICHVTENDSVAGNGGAKDALGSGVSCSNDEHNLDAAVNEGNDASELRAADKIPSAQNFNSEGSLPNPPILDGREAGVKHAEGAILPSSEITELEEVADDANAIGLSFVSKTEPASITFHFSSSDPDREEEGKTRNTDCEKPPQAQTMTRHGEISPAGEADSSVDEGVHREASFSGGVASLSSITYSGPIAYSGSISLRSESSAGSTRSFAFPVLQTEWNSSPVRMAKADQRHMRKQKGWVQSFICCRF